MPEPDITGIYRNVVTYQVGHGKPTNPPPGSINLDEISGALYIAGSTSTVQVTDPTKLPLGGNAESAKKLVNVRNPVDAGSAVQPVYFSEGLPVATTYELNATVPADAIFKYSAGTGMSISSSTISAKLKSTTALTADARSQTNTANRTYPVSIDKSGYLAVNVPWTTPSVFKGATTSAPGISGLVPLPMGGAAGDDYDKYLKGDGTWADTPKATYRESMNNGAYPFLFTPYTIPGGSSVDVIEYNKGLTINPSSGAVDGLTIDGGTIS